MSGFGPTSSLGPALPNAGIVAGEEFGFGSAPGFGARYIWVSWEAGRRRTGDDATIAVPDHAVIEKNTAAGAGFALGVGVRGEGGGPGDVAVAGWVVVVATFSEEPFGAGVDFTEGEKIGSDVGVVFWEMFFGDGELVHQRKAEVLLFCGEVDLTQTRRQACAE